MYIFTFRKYTKVLE